MTPRDILAGWKAQGTRLSVTGADTLIWRIGDGEPVVCLHGVPSSGFLYRKVLPALAARRLQGVTFDFPGLGFADRPDDFDYSWSGLARWTEAALEAAGIGRFHLVVHDIGGPIGFDLAERGPERILSLTALNTMVDVASFARPWMMEPFALPLIGPVWTAMAQTPVFLGLMRFAGTGPTPTRAEIMAYGALLRMGDGGRAFCRIMRGFERTEAFEARIKAALAARTYPAQVVWGRDDPTLRMTRYAPAVCAALGVENWHEVAGKHFLQEDSFEEIAELVRAIAAR
ncbi:alpha/beta fold hydrolase [Pseudoruegeria sp. HB172150]|uniref:alpha/beta fold hydrolase n=1 Tax=Pseudoruegeria sp. HB172150 TaxID=2721164 RepID=UPI001553A959|nr:alpha/beta fold hydrolase [Pseudoruegeria sp. HB172150]